ncbi:MAG: hypothetical protein U0519_01600 [Candidatus Gracilibacteria bacterium]
MFWPESVRLFYGDDAVYFCRSGQVGEPGVWTNVGKQFVRADVGVVRRGNTCDGESHFYGFNTGERVGWTKCRLIANCGYDVEVERFVCIRCDPAVCRNICKRSFSTLGCLAKSDVVESHFQELSAGDEFFRLKGLVWIPVDDFSELEDFDGFCLLVGDWHIGKKCGSGLDLEKKRWEQQETGLQRSARGLNHTMGVFSE